MKKLASSFKNWSTPVRTNSLNGPASTSLPVNEMSATPASPSPNTGEQYDYAVSLLNTGDYEEARDQFEDILKKDPNADYAHYGLAILQSMTGQADECLDHLPKAIELNTRNRIQARSDSDFQDMTDDPRFTELLYPEVS